VQTDHRIRAAKHLRRLVRPRSAVALTIVVSLLLPGVFSLTAPDLAWLLGTAPKSGETAGRHHDHGAAGHEKDYSDIPGSPGHPADHNCNPCQVLKYQASYLPQFPLLLPERAPSVFPPPVQREAQRAGHVAFLPPSRAPPQLAV